MICRKKNGEKRKYYRFRAARFYGGIATADCMGCNMDCAFCWSWKSRVNEEKKGKFYTSEEVADRLIEIASKHNFTKVRISGNEPTLCKEHLLGVLDVLEKKAPDILFVVETNGVILGRDEDFVAKLAKYNVHVRVSFKTGHKEDFQQVTSRPESWFDDQVRAVKYLYEHRISFHPAIVSEYYDAYLSERLSAISEDIPRMLEFEDLKIYPSIEKRMRERGLL